MESILLTAQSLFGLGVLVALAWGMSEARRKVDWRLVGIGVALQIALALLLLKVPFTRGWLFGLNGLIQSLQDATRAGTSFVFGYLGGGEKPFEVTNESALLTLAFDILPLIIVIAALSALLWHWRILYWVTKGFAWAVERTLGIGGAAGLSSAANLFMGMIEAPLFIRAYLTQMTRSELFLVMSVGLATVSGTVLILYANILTPVVPEALGHVLTASIISLPAAILIAKVMIPGEETTSVEAGIGILKYESSMDAVVQGTQEGLRMFLIILAMLTVVVAFVALADQILSLLPGIGTGPDGAPRPITLDRIFGWLFAPLVWLFGIPWNEAGEAGALMGTKTILNELLAYLKLASMEEGTLSPRSNLIMLYAMCGFANLGSVGILISGLTAIVPERRTEIANLGMKALIAGTLATGMTGTIVGIITF